MIIKTNIVCEKVLKGRAMVEFDGINKHGTSSRTPLFVSNVKPIFILLLLTTYKFASLASQQLISPVA